MFSIAPGIFHILNTLLEKSLKYLTIPEIPFEIPFKFDMPEKLLDVTLRLFMVQYGNRVVDVEWVIKLNKQGVSEKSIVKLLKLIILGTVNLLI